MQYHTVLKLLALLLSKTNLSIPSVEIPHECGSIFFEVQANKCKPIIVGIIYCPNSHPRAYLDLFMSTILYIHDKIPNKNKIAYLLGHYNIDLLYFVTKTITKTNDFRNCVIAQKIIPYITKPTRITYISATIIDHLYSNHIHPNYESEIIVTDIADHFGIFHLIYGTPPAQKIVYKQIGQLNIFT